MRDGVAILEHTHKSVQVRPALQARSRRTRDAILIAVGEALDKSRLDRATVHDLAAAAGVSVGAFYGRFPSKDAAIAGLYEQRRNAFVKQLQFANRRARSLEGWAKKTVILAMDYAILNRALIARAAQRDSLTGLVKTQGAAISIALSEDVARVLTRLAPDLPERQAPQVAAFAAAMLGGMTRDAAVFSESLLGGDARRKWFEQSLADAITSFVRARCAS